MITKQHSSPNTSKFLLNNSQVNIASHFLVFVSGIFLGVISTLYVQTFELSSNQISTSIKPPWLSLPPLPPPPSPPPHLPPPSPTPLLNTSIDEKELFWRASMVPKISSFPYEYSPKVAFLFLIRGGLPLQPLWEGFFKGHEGYYSIYVHSHPLFNDTTPIGSPFHGRRIPSQPVSWGTSSMIDAERRLLAHALLEHSNQRFVLLSESCIPLFNFTTVYNYLINSNLSYLGSYDDPRKAGRGRYNHQMWPPIPLSSWRKGSQWFELHRSLAIEVVSDTKYYPIFIQHCHMPCYNDEHYLPTLVKMIAPEMNSNRSVTWVDWSRGGPHPGRFSGRDVTIEFMERMRHGSNCTYNGEASSVCFLFARKFVANTIWNLMKIAPSLLGFDP